MYVLYLIRCLKICKYLFGIRDKSPSLLYKIYTYMHTYTCICIHIYMNIADDLDGSKNLTK